MLCKNCGTREQRDASDYCEVCESTWMSPDEQEALSRAHSDDVIRLLPLKSGAIAVFNNARDLCGIIDPMDTIESHDDTVWSKVRNIWYPPKKAPQLDLEELGLV